MIQKMCVKCNWCNIYPCPFSWQLPGTRCMI